jgi:asparagine synthase (glutamine-hydrolysing)
MCGIFAYYGKPVDPSTLHESFVATKHRGPNDSQFLVYYRYDDASSPTTPTSMIAIGFHRLSINGLDPRANQPFTTHDCLLACNGEIWNHPKMEGTSQTTTHSGSDCECLSGYYRYCQKTRSRYNHEIPFESLCEDIDGVFGLVLYDKISGQLMVGRDRLGIRSLYYAITNEGNLIVASELKSVVSLTEKDGAPVQAFLPGHWAEFDPRETVLVQTPFWTPNVAIEMGKDYQVQQALMAPLSDTHSAYEQFCAQIHDTLVNAVRKRFMSDRSLGCVLSGGLDSTVITAIACKLVREVDPDAPPLRTYTIGMAGATDFEWARKAAKHLGTEHHEFVLSEQEFLDAIPEVIAQIESYDVTTVRASTGNWLVAKKIAEMNKDTVLLCGDVADELLGGYRGFGLTNDAKAFQQELVQMITDIHRFDVLRCEKSFAGHGLEGRVPFGDRDLLDLVLRSPPEWLMWGEFNGRIEKEVVRHAFKDYLPKDVLWRRKEAFSDGVSSTQKSWYEIIQETLSKQHQPVIEREHVCPYDVESSYYRQVFEARYGQTHAEVIPRFWKQPFTTVVDPSARCLSNYESSKTNTLKEAEDICHTESCE